MTNVTEINAEAFERLAEFLEQRPELHRQEHWADNANLCGTTACLAGWACILETDKFVQAFGGKAVYFGPGDDLIDRFDLWEADYSEDPGEYTAHDRRNWMNVLSDNGYFQGEARHLLGLSVEDAGWLFDALGRPLHGLTVAQAMHKIAMGADIQEVWGFCDDETPCEQEGCGRCEDRDRQARDTVIFNAENGGVSW